MKTFQNRGEGFDVGEEFGRWSILNDVADQSTEAANRRHTRRDVVDDEISNLFRLKQRTMRFILTEREEKLDYRIRGFSVDDEILLGDEEISNEFCEVFFILRKRINGGFELRTSGGVGERFRTIGRIDESMGISKGRFRILCCCVFLHSLEDLQEFSCCKFLLGFFVVVENLEQRI